LFQQEEEIYMKKITIIVLISAVALACLCGGASAASFSSPLFPAFSSMSNSGSGLDISSGKISSSIGAAFIGTSPKVNYGVSVKGIGDLPAMGEISSFASMHSQTPSSDLSYSSSSSVSGLIKSFSVSYGMNL
jgi:hypothetical protein